MQSISEAIVTHKQQSFAELIRSIRHTEQLTLAALASRLRMSVANLSDIEQGRRLPGPKRAIAIANCLGLSEADLIARSLENQLHRHKIYYSVSLEPNPIKPGPG